MILLGLILEKDATFITRLIEDEIWQDATLLLLTIVEVFF